MRQIIGLDAAELGPDPRAVLRLQGIPPSSALPDRVRDLLDVALQRFAELAHPIAVVQSVSVGDFDEIYRGDGSNAADTPLERIYPRATGLALFAATVGAAVSGEIARLFEINELADAAMLDSAASEGADRMVDLLAGRFADYAPQGPADSRTAVLAYSPGYCGWHVSGQRRLFRALVPHEIGISLNASCLMEPLKSVSGVLVAGAPEIHDFDDDFDFCAHCATHECRARITRALEG